MRNQTGVGARRCYGIKKILNIGQGHPPPPPLDPFLQLTEQPAACETELSMATLAPSKPVILFQTEKKLLPVFQVRQVLKYN